MSHSGKADLASTSVHAPSRTAGVVMGLLGDTNALNNVTCGGFP